MQGDNSGRWAGTIVGIVIAVSFLVASASAQATAGNDALVARMVADYVKAWNAGDTAALNRMWAADGELISAEGDILDRRALMESKLAKPTGARPVLSIELSKVRMLAPNVAMIAGESRMTIPGGNAAQRTQFEGILTKQNDAWQIRMIRGLSSRPAPTVAPSEPLKDLAWTVGHWVGLGDTLRVHSTTDWDLGGRYLVSRWEYEPQRGEAYDAEVRAGWDPLTGNIKSWYFDSRGVISTSNWQKTGDLWLADVTGTQSDGTEFTATMVITPVDADSYLRTLTNVKAGGQTLPDQELRMFRVGAPQAAQ